MKRKVSATVNLSAKIVNVILSVALSVGLAPVQAFACGGGQLK
jgi:hypothetical protein